MMSEKSANALVKVRHRDLVHLGDNRRGAEGQIEQQHPTENCSVALTERAQPLKMTFTMNGNVNE